MILRSTPDDCLNAASSTRDGLRLHDDDLRRCDRRLVPPGGDGFDSNGDLTITGGTVVVDGQHGGQICLLDADGTITASGGTAASPRAAAGMGMKTLEAAQPLRRYGSTGFLAACRAVRRAVRSPRTRDFTIEDADGQCCVQRHSQMRCEIILFSFADVVATVRIPSRRATAPPKGPRRADGFHRHGAWGDGFPAADRSRTENRLRALIWSDAKRREARASRTGKCPKCPAASAPHRPAGREAPADFRQSPQRATVLPIH